MDYYYGLYKNAVGSAAAKLLKLNEERLRNHSSETAQVLEPERSDRGMERTEELYARKAASSVV